MALVNFRWISSADSYFSAPTIKLNDLKNRVTIEEKKTGGPYISIPWNVAKELRGK